MAEIVSGTALAKKVKQGVAERVKECEAKYGRVPHLVVILVGEDPGSVSYVTGKARDCGEVGFKNTTLKYPDTVSEEELLAKIAELNADDSVDGLLVQLPLPKHISEAKVIEAISKEKDVDGFHPLNVAALWQKQPCLLPCTPQGIIMMLEEAGVEIEGKRAVVIGRSNIVGLPASKLLLDHNATVTMAHSRTKNLAEVTRQADILVVAIGKPKFVTADMVKPGAAVMDVGVNRNPETGKLCGDVDFDAVKEVASVITPVPGGLGPMTRACLRSTPSSASSARWRNNPCVHTVLKTQSDVPERKKGANPERFAPFSILLQKPKSGIINPIKLRVPPRRLPTHSRR
ncbi:MAG: bifunctional methylenetetrahydrofolate dehydrogenase/methenyltetrahydrofolate cyclohydrolase [Muribaculaceae bacterium]|nr:bifunctional methylenetetrahydrofolate dehydrogenase/methenyltetrahydrofolate cyclohydrolase [Muribaculaceae bacterium]